MSNLNNNRTLKLTNFYSKSILPRFEDVRGFTRPAIMLRNLGINQISEKIDNYYRVNLTSAESRNFADIDLLKKYVRIEYDLTLNLLDMIEEDTVFYDIGGFQGYHTLIGSIGKKAYAFEPDPNNLEKLQKNIQLNPEQEIEIIKKPVWNKIEKISLEVGKDGESSVGDGEIEKESITIDEFVLKKGNTPPDLIKIDVEGAEQKVLEGGEKTLEKFSPKILIEIHDKETLQKFESSKHHINLLLENKGYYIKKEIDRGDQIQRIYSVSSR